MKFSCALYLLSISGARTKDAALPLPSVFVAKMKSVNDCFNVILWLLSFLDTTIFACSLLMIVMQPIGRSCRPSRRRFSPPGYVAKFFQTKRNKYTKLAVRGEASS